MAPQKGRKRAPASAKNSHIIANSAEMEAKRKRIGDLKVKFAGITKALRPALAEMAGRTSNHNEGRQKSQYDTLIVELDKVRDSEIGRCVACHETRQELRAVSVQHETLQEMIVIENQYKAKVDEIRESSLIHLRLSVMTDVVQKTNGLGADLENLGQGSNQRTHRKPDPHGNHIARYKDTKASQNEHFYWSTQVMWDDWMHRMRANPEMAGILPRPYCYIQAERIESGARGHRMQLHGSKDKGEGADSTWIGGMGKLPYLA